jgi:hypothetical protein
MLQGEKKDRENKKAGSLLPASVYEREQLEQRQQQRVGRF